MFLRPLHVRSKCRSDYLGQLVALQRFPEETVDTEPFAPGIAFFVFARRNRAAQKPAAFKAAAAPSRSGEPLGE
jgi:hypothetical protein